MPRAFVALVPDATVLDALDRLEVQLRPHVESARWTPRERRHVTVAFLGDDTDLDVAAERLGLLAAGTQGPFTIGLCGIGAFPRPRAAQVLWCGVGPGRDRLDDLARRAVDVFGLTVTQRFVGHLTMARCSPAGDRSSVVDRVWRSPQWTVDELLLVESVDEREGVRYRVRSEEHTSEL